MARPERAACAYKLHVHFVCDANRRCSLRLVAPDKCRAFTFLPSNLFVRTVKSCVGGRKTATRRYICALRTTNPSRWNFFSDVDRTLSTTRTCPVWLRSRSPRTTGTSSAWNWSVAIATRLPWWQFTVVSNLWKKKQLHSMLCSMGECPPIVFDLCHYQWNWREQICFLIFVL